MEWANVVVLLKDLADAAREDRARLLAGGTAADFGRLLAVLQSAVSKATVRDIEALIERPPREGLVQDVEEAVIAYWGMTPTPRRVYAVTAGRRTRMTAVISVAAGGSRIERFCLARDEAGVRRTLGPLRP